MSIEPHLLHTVLTELRDYRCMDYCWIGRSKQNFVKKTAWNIKTYISRIWSLKMFLSISKNEQKLLQIRRLVKRQLDSEPVGFSLYWRLVRFMAAKTICQFLKEDCWILIDWVRSYFQFQIYGAFYLRFLYCQCILLSDLFPFSSKSQTWYPQRNCLLFLLFLFLQRIKHKDEIHVIVHRQLC